MTVIINPENGITLSSWSIETGTPKPTTMPADVNQTAYFIYYGYGTKPSKPWEFYIDLKVR